jgi:hypothetical protein
MGNASKYHLTKPLPSFARTSDAAVAVTDPSVDSASTLPHHFFVEILRKKIKMKIKGEVLRV